MCVPSRAIQKLYAIWNSLAVVELESLELLNLTGTHPYKYAEHHDKVVHALFAVLRYRAQVICHAHRNEQTATLFRLVRCSSAICDCTSIHWEHTYIGKESPFAFGMAEKYWMLYYANWSNKKRGQVAIFFKTPLQKSALYCKSIRLWFFIYGARPYFIHNAILVSSRALFHVFLINFFLQLSNCSAAAACRLFRGA
jgi:hypothetical protein